MRFELVRFSLPICLTAHLSACASSLEDSRDPLETADDSKSPPGDPTEQDDPEVGVLAPNCAIGTWAAQTLSSGASGVFVNEPALAVATTGELHLIHDLHDGVGQTAHRTRDPVRGIWGPISRAPFVLGTSDLAIDDAGDLHVAQCGIRPGTLSYARRAAASGAWSRVDVHSAVAGDGTMCEVPAIQVGQDGTVHITYSRRVDDFPGSTYRLHHAVGDGIGPFAIETVDEHIRALPLGIPSDLVVDDAGIAHAFYKENLLPESLLWHARLVPGQAVVKEIVHGGDVSHLSAAAAPAGSPHIFYFDRTTRQLLHMPLGCTLVEPIEVDADFPFVSSIVGKIDAAGGAHLLYAHVPESGGPATRLSYVYRPITGGYTTRVLAEGPNLGSIDLEVDALGRPHVVYRDNVGDLEYLHCTSP